MAKIIVNAKDTIMGRTGTFVAKELIKGNEVAVINSDAVVISGEKKLTIAKYMRLRKMGAGGSLKGPKFPRVADRFLKRVLRGMLPSRERATGRDALKRLRCYVKGGPFTEEEAKSAVTFKHRVPRKYITIKQLMEALN